MKRILTVIFLCTAICNTHAQLAKTQWHTRINTGELVHVVWQFNHDTCAIVTVTDSIMIETMQYQVKDSILTLHKTEGQSDCDNTTPGVYKFWVSNDTLHLHMVKDDCDDRSSTVDNTAWVPWVVPTEVKVDEAILKQYVGTYQFDEPHPIYITLENGRLYAEGPNNNLPKSPLTAESQSRFFLRIAGVSFDFIKDAGGRVVSFISHEAEDHELKKVK